MVQRAGVQQPRTAVQNADDRLLPSSSLTSIAPATVYHFKVWSESHNSAHLTCTKPYLKQDIIKHFQAQALFF